MAKGFSASDMLRRNRGAAATETEPEKVTSPLVDPSTSEAVDESSKAVEANGSTSPLVNGSTGAHVNGSTSSPVEQTPAFKAERYSKHAVFLAPHQAAWIKEQRRNLPTGLSTSDLARYGIELAMKAAENGDLHAALIAQAKSEAERYVGRRNSGVGQLED